MTKFRTPVLKVSIGLSVFLSVFSTAQNSEFIPPDPVNFRSSMSSDFNDPSLGVMREKIIHYTQANPDKFAIFSEIGSLSHNNPNLSESARRVFSNLNQGFGTKSVRNIYKWAPFIDLNNDKNLGFLDWLDLEIFKSRIIIDEFWPANSQMDSQTKNLGPEFLRKGSDLLPQIEQSKFRYEELLGLLEQNPNSPTLRAEKDKIENAFKAILRQIELSSLQPVIRSLDEIENLFSRLFEIDSQWRHRPLSYFRFEIKNLDAKTLGEQIKKIKNQLAGWENLRTLYPSMDFSQSWINDLQLILLKVVETEEFLNKLGGKEIPSLEVFLSNPKNFLEKTNLLYSFEDRPQDWKRVFYFRFQNISNSEVLGSLLSSGVSKKATTFNSSQLNLEWVDNLSSLFEGFSYVNFSDRLSKLSRIAEFYSLRKSYHLAFQWMARMTKVGADPNRPSFEVIGETLSWELLKISEVNAWAAEFFDTFVSRRLATLNKIANDKGVNLAAIEKQIEEVQAQRKQLKLEIDDVKKQNNGQLSEETEIQFEEREDILITRIERLDGQRSSVLNSPEVLAFSQNLLETYQKRMNWPSYFDPRRMDQIEAALGFDQSAKNLFAVLKYLENQDDWVQIDLNNDGEINSADLAAARLLIRSLIQKN